MLTTAPETHGPYSGPPVAKRLVYGQGSRSLWGDRASSLPRFIIVFGSSSSGGHFFKPWWFWNLLGISIWDLRFRTSTDGQTRSRFQDLDRRRSGFQNLDKRTNDIWVSGLRQMDRQDLGFRTSTDKRTN
jgi:hypothetical protein